MTSIAVPFGRSGARFIIDMDEYERVTMHKWNTRRKPERIYVYTVIDGKKVPLHRFILGLTDPSQAVDHINGDALDNRRSNLRLCSTAQNRANAKRNINSASGFKGVRRSGLRWRATIQVEGKKISLGSHDSPQEAHQAYINAARQYFGEFANGG